MTFYKYLEKQTGRGDIVGDFARAVINTLPESSVYKTEDRYSYWETTAEKTGEIEGLHHAWSEYTDSISVFPAVHIDKGNCPTEQNPFARDKKCIVCQALLFWEVCNNTIGKRSLKNV